MGDIMIRIVKVKEVSNDSRREKTGKEPEGKREGIRKTSKKKTRKN
jgi:hypothetical protein